jgi:tagatose-1,6-bisphosphate aldolase
VLLDPEVGAAQTIADGSLPPRAGLMVAVEASGYAGEPTARRSRLLAGWSVAKAKRIGADAVKLLVYYHPQASTTAHQEALLAEVADACARADLPLFLEPLGYSLDPAVKVLSGEARRAVVVETARRLTRIGGDVLKAEFPYDAEVVDPAAWWEACAALDDASAVPWVLLSGGVDDALFEAQLEVACQAGASGALVGRSVWAPAATLSATDRDAWLTTEGRRRLGRLAELVDRLGRPWRERSRLAGTNAPGEGWFLEYPE